MIRKEAIAVKSVKELKKLITETNKPQACKTVGGGTVVVYMTEQSIYISDGQELRRWLFDNYKLEP